MKTGLAFNHCLVVSIASNVGTLWVPNYTSSLVLGGIRIGIARKSAASLFI